MTEQNKMADLFNFPSFTLPCGRDNPTLVLQVSKKQNVSSPLTG